MKLILLLQFYVFVTNFLTLSAANFPVNIAMGTPAGL